MNANPDNGTRKLAPLDALEALRQVNASMRSAAIHMQPEQNHCSAITSRDFFGLGRQIRRGAKCVSVLAADSTATTRQEVATYRDCLESLQQFLPDLHHRLLAEKSRLEAARDQVTATAAWVHASQKTM